MARKRNNKPAPWQTIHEDGGGHFVRLYDDLTDSAAWRSLSASAKLAYLTIIKAQAKDPASNIVRISYAAFRADGIRSDRTITKVIKEMEQKGFLKIDGGGLNNVNSYLLSKDWRTYIEKPCR